MLNIVTPCSRPGNLLQVFHSIVKANEKFKYEINWHICVDSLSKEVAENPHIFNLFSNQFWYGLDCLVYFCADEKSIVGNSQRNYVLDKIKNNNWVIFIDDDNLINPDFLPFLIKFEKDYPEKQGFIVAQDRREDLNIILDPTKIGVGLNKTDGGQLCFKKSIIGSTRWIPDKYNADGYFLSEIYEKHKDEIVLVSDILSYRNKLR